MSVAQVPRFSLPILRPRTRGECANVPRPCPFVSCSKHLYLDVNPDTEKLKLNFPDIEPHQMIESCSQDMADRGPQTLEAIGAAVNVTRERARQIVETGLAKMRRANPDLELPPSRVEGHVIDTSTWRHRP